METKTVYLVGEKFFYNKEEALTYEKRENLYNEITTKYMFDENQRNEIKLGIEKDLNVLWYSRPEFNHLQMREIREGLELGLNVSIYAKNYFDYKSMN